MNRSLFLSILLLGVGWHIHAQSPATRQPIDIVKKPLGEVYQQNGKTLNAFKLSKVLRTDREARHINRQSLACYLVGIPTTLAGGLIMAGASAGPGETDWLWFSTGLSCLSAGTTLNVLGAIRQQTAVEVYNANLAGQSYLPPKPGVELELVLQGNGGGFRLWF